jgi:sec-independent protein translocase protein TatC
MPLVQHLSELRRRLAFSGAAVLAGAVAGWFLTDPFWRLLQSPVLAIASTDGRRAALNFDTVAGAFDLRIQLAVQLGLVLSAPLWLWQVFAFIVPALTRREKRVTLAFTLTVLPLFVAGAGMGLWVLPHMVQLLAGFAPEHTASYISATGYYDFVLKLVLATGIAFVLPVFLVLLNALGVVRGRTILRAWRPALLLILGFTAIATPAADVLSMLVLAAPMVGLFFAAALISVVGDRRRDRRLEAALRSAVTAG